MWNAGLDEVQAGIKIAMRSINNLRYADDTTLIAESKEDLKEPLDESEKGEWKSWLKTTFKKLRSWHPIMSRQIDGETMETVIDFTFLGSKITLEQPGTQKTLAPWKDWYWSWSSNTLATWCKDLTH